MLTTIWMPVSSLLVDTPPVHRHRRLIHLHKDFSNSTYKPVVGRNHFVDYQLVKRDAGRASVRPCLTWHLVIGGNRPVWSRVRADNGVVAFNAIQTNAAINAGNSGGDSSTR